jgi:hypothetical protein
MTTYYKVTDHNGQSYHGGSGKWTRNRWRSVEGEIVPCDNGLHLCRREDLLRWLGPVIWKAEVDGEVVEADDKVVARRARVIERYDTWNERTARLFAADCAEYALKYASADAVPTLEAVIYTVRCYADGQATEVELAAAWTAAEAAAWTAAERAGWTAAWAAARAAAEAAAWTAAEDAASAARAAAWAAARAAAERAGWTAAEAAARAAARDELTDRLFDYLEGRA